MAMAWVTTCWWTIDICISFMTGVHVDGVVEMRLWRIARRYIRSWFVPDVSIVLMDWAFLLIGVSDAAGLLRVRRSARALRIIRAIRLIRVVKVADFLSKIADSLNSEFLLIMMRIFKLVISVVFLNHYIACAWYGIALTADKDECTWLRKYDVDTFSDGYKYTTSLHWSMTQFMPASMEVNPCNLTERSFTLGVLVFGLVTFSSFVSSITTVMAQLANISKDRSQAEGNLRQYLCQNRISVDLGIRIRQYFRDNYEARRKRVHEIDIGFFGQMPESLKVELRREIYMPVITLHPLLCRYALVDSAGSWLLCHLTMSQQSWLPGQTIFLRGELATEMLFVLSGDLDYFLRRSGHTRVKMDQWLCEGALWSKTWYYNGRMTAVTNTELYGMSASKFRAISGERWPSFRYLQLYATRFMEAVREAQKSSLPLTDLCEDVEAIGKIVEEVFEDRADDTSQGTRDINYDLDEVRLEDTGAFSDYCERQLSTGSVQSVQNEMSMNVQRTKSTAQEHMREKRHPQRVRSDEVAQVATM
jgi:hypothetical protein